ncbi:flagellar filament capping protein FliD [Pseudomonas marincola]|uniref:flagellar filament capping protein FliD n=1 Tax=Pseudomonas marincola TaxID=437900 RepID=UPI0008F03209|nr:flagellar filament capping protein FliD [Pseudomonas marincola]SFT79793.1 flagellar hook-associated protein 2 [Pseudomonas marincola]
MVGITGLGGSGLDIDSIVSALVNADSAPKTAQLSRLETATTSKFSALGTLKGALSEFQTALAGLNDITLFENRTASSSNTSSLTASASKNALPGTYSVVVNSLATSSKVATAAVASTFESGATEETFSVQLGASGAATEVKIAAGSDLASTRDQLNTALKDQGISANIVNNPSTGEARLVFSSTTTGAGNDIIVSGTGNLSALSADGSQAMNSADPASAGYITQSADAEFSVDGLVLNSKTNTVTDAIPDVTLSLVAVTESGKNATVKVGQDTSGVTANIKKFVDAYNTLITTSNELTRVVSVGEGKEPVTGGLVGDATVRNLLSAVRKELVNPANQAGISALADMGITTQKDGTLAIDDTKLQTAITDNFDSIGTFFTGDTGLTSRLDSKIDGFIKGGGVLEQRMDGLQSTLTNIDKQKEDLNRRIESLQERLYKQFNAMDALVSQLSQTSDRLTQSLEALPGIVKKDN